MSERSERTIDTVNDAGIAADHRAAVAAAVAGYVAALGSGDPDQVVAHVTEDFVNQHASDLGTGCVGRDAYRQRLPGFLGRFRGLRYDVEDLVIEGDKAVAAYRMSCDYLDDDGRAWPVSLPGVFRFTVADGLIATRVDYWDGASFQRQVSE